MKNIAIYFCLSLLFFLGACEQERIDLKPETEVPAGEYTSGSADFSKYVAVGGSLSAGYQAGALFNAGQENSLPAILATQFEAVGGGDFNQPDINSENGFNTLFENPDPGSGAYLGRLRLQGNPPQPAPILGEPIGEFEGNVSELNNFSVPGILLGQALTPATGGPDVEQNPAYNPFYARFASSPGSSTIIGDAVMAQGTFFSFWLGNIDVLGYAASGATNEALFTPVANFTGQYQAALNALTTDPNVQGVVGNIPDVTLLPYFNLVPFNALVIDAATADQLNQGYTEFNMAINSYNAGGFGSVPENPRPIISFSAGANPLVIVDPTLHNLQDYGIPSIRQLKAGELVLFTAAPEIPKGFGSQNPLPDDMVLTMAQIQTIKNRIGELNTAIENTVNAVAPSRVAIADVNTAFAQLVVQGAAGIIQDGVLITASLAPPFGGISEDGIHPNSRGYAFLANVFIDAINAKFGATIPKANIAHYPGTALPIPE